MKMYLAWILVLIGTLGSLYASDVLGFEPCSLCWYQRICLYPLAIILPISLWQKDLSIVKYIIALPILGAAIAVCQIMIQVAPSTMQLPICGSGKDCQTPSFQLLGWITMPMLSALNFCLITYLLGSSKK